uniref:Uncharacterized protein n=1 Tax=Trichuris muris TaxID=70415 RepID=A0A5S6QAC6_TRIMR
MEFDVVPECALQNEHISFTIGMPLCQTIACLQRRYQLFKGIELLYSDKDPLSTDIILYLSHDGIRLVFDSWSQLLKVIEVIDMTKTSLSYCGNLFSSPNDLPSIEKINQTFSATHPGVYDSSQRIYTLSWRGLSVLFPAASNVTPYFAHGLSSLQFAEDCSLLVSKLIIYHGNSLAEARAPEMPISCYHGNCYCDSVEILRRDGKTNGLRVKLKCERFDQSSYSDCRSETLTKDVYFGDCSQEITGALGYPNNVYYKSEDKMKIHLPSTERKRQNEKADYFYNYFTLGMNCWKADCRQEEGQGSTYEDDDDAG